MSTFWSPNYYTGGRGGTGYRTRGQKKISFLAGQNGGGQSSEKVRSFVPRSLEYCTPARKRGEKRTIGKGDMGVGTPLPSHASADSRRIGTRAFPRRGPTRRLV